MEEDKQLAFCLSARVSTHIHVTWCMWRLKPLTEAVTITSVNEALDSSSLTMPVVSLIFKDQERTEEIGALSYL